MFERRKSGYQGRAVALQVELFCISRLLNCSLETDEEFFYIDALCPIGEPPVCRWICSVSLAS